MRRDSRKDQKKREITETSLNFSSDYTEDERLLRIYNILNDTGSKNKTIRKNSSEEDAENIYKFQLKRMIEQVYEILNDKKEAWDYNDEELYALLERIIFLKARENTFRDFFENMESVIESASQLDFSKRAPISKISKDQRNLFNYAVTCLNILIEKMESSVVSMKSVNTMLSLMPEKIMIVTNTEGVIRFVSDMGEKLLGLKKNEFIGKSLYLLMDEHSQISEELKTKGEIKNKRINLITSNQEHKKLSAFLTIPKAYKDNTEIEEIIYCITLDKDLLKDHENKYTLLQELHDKIAPLNTIINTTDLLNKRVIDSYSKELINEIKNNAETLKENSIKALNPISNSAK